MAGYREQEPGPVAFLFPGQGPQYVNMAAGFICMSASSASTWTDARKFSKRISILIHVMFLYPASGGNEQAAVLLDQIKYTTPILFTVEYALAKLWLEWGLKPAGMIGHSTGEYAQPA